MGHNEAQEDTRKAGRCKRLQGGRGAGCTGHMRAQMIHGCKEHMGANGHKGCRGTRGAGGHKWGQGVTWVETPGTGDIGVPNGLYRKCRLPVGEPNQFPFFPVFCFNAVIFTSFKLLTSNKKYFKFKIYYLFFNLKFILCININN